LIREQVPDKNGRLLPQDLTSGSYALRDLTDKFIGSLYEGKIIYDKTFGHVTYGCGGCCGYSQSKLRISPLGIPLLSTSDNGVQSYDTCGAYWDDTDGSFYGNWTTANTAITTADYYGTHTGKAVGSTTSSTVGYLLHTSIRDCPNVRYAPQGSDNVEPQVSIGYFSQNPILKGNTATVQVTVNSSATITLAIAGNGSGAATFNGSGGPTTLTISGTTTVTIYGSAASTNSGDLTLSASYLNSLLAYASFSVTSGACTLGSESDSGSGPKTCPSTVTLKSKYTISQYCSTCIYTCSSVHTDGTWVPGPGNCTSIATNVGGTLTAPAVTSATATFSASDCNYHYAYFVTKVTNAQGVPTSYPGANIGLKCTSYPNGSLCP
jgi:hypothetical protein